MTVLPASVVSHRVDQGSGLKQRDVDPIATEVIRHGLDAAADQMRVVLNRTAFSPIIYEMTDFAAAIYDDKCRLLAQAHALPLFLGTLSFCVESTLERIGGADRLAPGDIIFSTYGYDIGSHQQDAVVIAPAFWDDKLIGFSVVKAHQMDIAAKDLYCTDTVDIFQEGVIFPSVWLYRRGERQEDIYRTIVANSRLPVAIDGDLNAQVGAARVGIRELERVIARYGLESFKRATERMFDHGEALVRRFFESIPDGSYSAEGAFDGNGITDESIPFEVTVHVSGGDICIDFSESPPLQPGPVNCPLAATVSTARIAIMTFAGGNESANEGHFRPIEVRTRPGTQFHAVPPAPIFLYGWTVIQALDVIHKALAEALPDTVPAGSGGDLCSFTWWGYDADGNVWGDATDQFIGQGGSARGDANAPMMHISCSGIRSIPIESFEARRPILTERFEFVEDSCGSGKFRGGPGVHVHYRALTEMFLCSCFDRTKTPPWGLHGGSDGLPNRFVLRTPDGEAKEYRKETGLRVPAGSVMEIRTGSGGGFGPPEERSSEAVLEDVANGLLSEEKARRDYPHAFAEESAVMDSGVTA